MLTTISLYQDLQNIYFLMRHRFSDAHLPAAKLEKKTQECLQNMDFNSNCTPNRTLRAIKACLIAEYLSQSATVPAKVRMTVTLVNTERKLAVLSIPQDPLFLEENDHLLILKSRYMNHLTDDASADKKLMLYLNHEGIKILANKIDRDMASPLTLQKLAGLVALDYKNELQQAIRSAHFDPGADDLADACLALTLLQKNTRFSNALTKLYQYTEKDNGFFDFIKAACLNYQAGLNAIGICSWNEKTTR